METLIAKVTSNVASISWTGTMIFNTQIHQSVAEDSSLDKAQDFISQLGLSGLKFGQNAGFSPLNGVAIYATNVSAEYSATLDAYNLSFSIGEKDFMFTEPNGYDIQDLGRVLGFNISYSKNDRTFTLC